MQFYKKKGYSGIVYFYDAVHTPEAGSHLLQSYKQWDETTDIHIATSFHTSNIFDFQQSCVTFSHVSGEPVSHIPSTEVEHGSELVDIAQSLVQFHDG